MKSNLVTYMTGFEEFGESIFNKNTARQTFKRYSITEITDAMNNIIGQNQRFNILMTFYCGKNSKNYWTLKKIYPETESDDEFGDELQSRSDDENKEENKDENKEENQDSDITEVLDK